MSAQDSEDADKNKCVVHVFRNDTEWINIKRTIVKAPQIFKQKINVGNQLPNDEGYQLELSRFKEFASAVTVLETEILRYTAQMKAFMAHSIQIGEALANVFDPALRSPYEVCKNSQLCAEEDFVKYNVSKQFVEVVTNIKTAISTDLDLITDNVIIPLTRLVNLTKNVKRFIKERDFCLLDANEALNNFENLNSKEKTLLTSKQHQNLLKYERNFELSKLKYEQLNELLKSGIPAFLALGREFIKPLHLAFYFLQLTMKYRLLQGFDDLLSLKAKRNINESSSALFSEYVSNEFQNRHRPSKDLLESLSLIKPSLFVNINSVRSSDAVANDHQNETKVDTGSVRTINQFCIAKYSYEAQQEGDLSFQKGDKIKIIDQKLKDWWKGELNGQIGVFPINYTEMDLS